VEEEGGNVLAEYAYNALGQRVIKETGGETRVFIYDLEGRLVVEALMLKGRHLRERVEKLRLSLIKSQP